MSEREERRTTQGVEYEHVGEEYLQQRQLQKGAAGWVLLAGLGVAYVISGEIGGWQFGLAEGGWGGLLIATILTAVMYTAMVYSLAELSAAIPVAGAGYGFARRAMGVWGGLIVAMFALLTFAALILIFAPGGGGSAEIQASDAPLTDALASPNAYGGKNALFAFVNVVGIAGLIASFYSLIYAYSRQIFALSRAGYLPRWLSITSRRHVPWVALVVPGVIG